MHGERWKRATPTPDSASKLYCQTCEPNAPNFQGYTLQKSFVALLVGVLSSSYVSFNVNSGFLWGYKAESYPKYLFFLFEKKCILLVC